MTIPKVHYSARIFLGNSSSECLGFAKDINPDDDIKLVIEELRALVKSCGLPKFDELLEKYSNLKSEIETLERKLEAKTADWNAMAEFLRTQGIKPDATNMPQFSKLLSPVIEEENTSLIEIDTDDIQF
ncbi:hypothetical protein [Microseira wollei]|uniref:Uncharacterized protein n=1 Tax=Microseira wollei NIES-4236 TaxID=2530354 RepID=A0AAV3XF24_9CYAN|nr:hypothetical protein [Microseira wollei]GET40475.1 hypothetical protein MiSe_52840 [Microseira wollei NIES-4236]